MADVPVGSVRTGASPSRSGRRTGAGLRRAGTALIVAALLSPVMTNRDSFPLSTYPVYASDRGREATFATVRAFDAGGPRRLSMRTIAGTDDPLVAQARVAAAIADGAVMELCLEVLRRAPGDVRAVEVVEERHDVVAHVEGAPSLLSHTVHGRCEAQG